MKNEDNISDTIYLNVIDFFLGKKWKLPHRQETSATVIGTLSTERGQWTNGKLDPAILTHMI